ncbi:type II toxin-antitoxin system RelE/ParE family toxin [Ruminiclostridium herbifermentans]|uniref:type II toxin-antitoxin system RelE/ParE family toxin n=1 Tax=Ruminiclostridium herbifermentans TaxID=2488810 RepID=UPI0019630347|nr:type II toxin-antitoxin system RelE/ParE family toxin [Ruminiclostridium herbifermentans]
MNEKYRLVYLPVAKQDMIDIMRYISHELGNSSAATKLAEEMIEAADKLTTFPYAHQVYQPIRTLKQEYRKLIVQNYIMIY